jgi:hypothetical protein
MPPESQEVIGNKIILIRLKYLAPNDFVADFTTGTRHRARLARFGAQKIHRHGYRQQVRRYHGDVAYLRRGKTEILVRHVPEHERSVARYAHRNDDHLEIHSVFHDRHRDFAESV